MSDLAEQLKAKAQKEEAATEETAAPTKKSGVDNVGLDLGTSYVVTSVIEDGELKQSSIRSAFLELEAKESTMKMLKKLGHAYMQTGNKAFLIGEPAIELGNLFSEEIQRPMNKGVLSPSEKEAITVMRMLIKESLKDIAGSNTKVVYSSPADPVDGSFSTLYHQNLMKEILEGDLGVEAVPMNEAHALGYSELQDDGFTGLCFSFGAGMVNAVLSYAGIDAVSFSISKGGDWIDANAAQARGTTAGQMQQIKETGTDLHNPQTPDEQAIAIYYKQLIKEAIVEFNKRFTGSADAPKLTKPIPVVVAGGTSKANGFLDVFKDMVEKEGFPFEVKEIRQAQKPLHAVSEGLLLAAME